MSNELATITPANIMTADTGASWCSIQAQPGDRDAAAKIFNAINEPDAKIADYINKTIHVRDVLIETVEIVNEETGMIDKCPRVVLIDEDGKSYAAVSVGMLNVVKNAVACFGKPSWEPALEFDIIQKPVKNGSMLTAKVR